MNPAILKLLARMKQGGKAGLDAAGAGMGSLAGMAARNPKTAAGVGALGAGGVGAGIGAMSDDEPEGIEEILELLMQAKEKGQGMVNRGRSAMGM
jgi:hypothetical protein